MLNPKREPYNLYILKVWRLYKLRIVIMGEKRCEATTIVVQLIVNHLFDQAGIIQKLAVFFYKWSWMKFQWFNGSVESWYDDLTMMLQYQRRSSTRPTRRTFFIATFASYQIVAAYICAK